MAQGSSFLLDPLAHKVKVGLAWDAGVDVDSSAVLLGADRGIIDMIWFRKLRSSCGAVSHRLIHFRFNAKLCVLRSVFLCY